MEEKVLAAEKLLKAYKKKDYVFGIDCLDALGSYVEEFGRNILLIISQNDWAAPLRNKIKEVLSAVKINIKAQMETSRENSPKEDVFKLADLIRKVRPDCIVCVGGGSAIDAAKAANVLASIEKSNDVIEKYFGTGVVTQEMESKNIKKLFPFIAVQVASGSASHITRYSNVTDYKTKQKKLIIDDAIIPSKAVFDYKVSESMPEPLTKDGAMDGLSHCLEAYYGYDEQSSDFKLAEKICLTGTALIVESLPYLLNNPKDTGLRKKIGLATDLGGYAIMLHGTNGAHLNSFSFVDILSHGRACAILNPYYTVFFSPSIENKLKKLAPIYQDFSQKDLSILKKEKLGLAVAEAMVEFSKAICFPTTLSEVKGFSQNHIDRALQAAKNPQLESKLNNMPVPITREEVDVYMKPVLEAAKDGSFSKIRYRK